MPIRPGDCAETVFCQDDVPFCSSTRKFYKNSNDRKGAILPAITICNLYRNDRVNEKFLKGRRRKKR